MDGAELEYSGAERMPDAESEPKELASVAFLARECGVIGIVLTMDIRIEDPACFRLGPLEVWLRINWGAYARVEFGPPGDGTRKELIGLKGFVPLRDHSGTHVRVLRVIETDFIEGFSMDAEETPEDSGDEDC